MDNSRRALLFGAGAVAVGAAASACSGSSGTTGGNVGQEAGTVNDMTVQLGQLSVDAFNQMSNEKNNPGSAYPITLMKSSLELRQQRERLLRFNTTTKRGWIYLFSNNGNLLASFAIQGKVSSTESSMTSTTGVYIDQGTGGGGNVPVPLPGDDGSFGQNEGAVFWFNENGVMQMWNGLWLYADAQLDVPDLLKQNAVSLSASAKPSSTAQGSALFQ